MTKSEKVWMSLVMEPQRSIQVGDVSISVVVGDTRQVMRELCEKEESAWIIDMDILRKDAVVVCDDGFVLRTHVRSDESTKNAAYRAMAELGRWSRALALQAAERELGVSG